MEVCHTKLVFTGTSKFNFVFFVLLLMCRNLIAQDTTSIEHLEAEYDENEETILQFQHMTLDRNINTPTSRNLYVGALNRLYQLNKDTLTKEQTVDTGPVPDNVACHPHKIDRCDNLINADNINKLLLIDYENNRLISCGSVRQGICELRKLNNIKMLENDFSGINDERSDTDYVAANKNLSTVAFLAGTGKKLSMFVGSSKTSADAPGLLHDGELLMTVSKRRIEINPMDHLMFSSYKRNGESGDEKFLGLYTKNIKESGVGVNFIQAFAFTNTGYFVLTHPEPFHNKNSRKSYIAQVCIGDNWKEATDNLFNSYLELPIQSPSRTRGSSYKYKLASASAVAEAGRLLANAVIGRRSQNKNVLFVSFTADVGGSAVALFPMFEVDDLFLNLIRGCLQDDKKSDFIEWQNENQLTCVKRGMTLNALCSEGIIWDVAGLRRRKMSMTGKLIFESSDTMISSIAVTTVDQDYTALFLGTTDGRILKIKVDGVRENLTPYEVIEIDTEKFTYHSIPYHIGKPKILPDMQLDINQESSYLYAMTERVVVKMPLQNCSRFSTCDTCLGLTDPSKKDPFCVWCTLENKCVKSASCISAVSKTKCPEIKAKEPISLTKEETKISLRATEIPLLFGDEEYKCRYHFGKKDIKEVNAEYLSISSELKCPMPNIDSINDKLNEGKAVITVSLYKPQIDSDIVDFVSTNVTFYKCPLFTSCTQCLIPPFNCHWCIDLDQQNSPDQCFDLDHRCKSTVHEVKTGGQCPQLEKLNDDYQYIHAGEEKTFEIPVQNLKKLRNDDNFKCIVTVPGMASVTYDAQRTGENIQCFQVRGVVPSGESKTQADVVVRWKDNYVIDNPFNIKITMYKCSSAEKGTCGQCLESEELLKCGWCELQKACTLCESCLDERSCISSDSPQSWLKSEPGSTSICRMPSIQSFTPKSAPIRADTVVTINGENLGLSGFYNDIIKIGEQPCVIVKTPNNTAQRVQCTVSDMRDDDKSNIEFCIPKGANCESPEYKAISTEKFSFVTPTITSFSPMEGYYKGGTPITFQGSHLDTGNSIHVDIGQWKCIVDRGSLKDTIFTCIVQCLEGDDSELPHKVQLSFDGYLHTLNDQFLFKKNAKITSLSTTKSIKSGGIKVIVKGTNLNVIRNLTMVVTKENELYSRECDFSESTTTRTCLTPSIEGVKLGVYDLMFIADGCGEMLPTQEQFQAMEYKTDPRLNAFEGENAIKDYSGGTLVISGHNLCADPSHCDMSTVTVKIGEELCNISSLDVRQIVCQPAKSSGTQPVLVEIGDYRQDLGSLRFKDITSIIVIIVALVLLFLISVVIFVVCFTKRRSNKNLETVRELQMRLDMMEAKVAKECREAFAELQTDMTELDNMSGGGIPFRNYQDYIMRVLFPDRNMYDRLTVTDQQFYMPNNGRHMQNAIRGRFTALESFDKLIEDQNFLLIFIKTLENQPGFTMKDKGNVAGLLMIILQDRLQYATTILTCLLEDLIRSNIEGNSHPKLLLRRTESVAEKMLTHWFSVLLHPFLKDCAGDPLYWLFRAIKQQIDKGPVDAVTGEAKYSLSEDKLIRQTVDYTPLVLQIVDEDSPNSVPLPVKVLDCDTISQAKEKIIAVLYKNRPYSEHPNPNTFQLQLHKDTNKKILADEDSSNKIEGLWKKINMLRDYDVRDGSKISLKLIEQSAANNLKLNSSFSSADHPRSGMRSNGSSNRLGNMEQQSLLRSMPQSRSGTPTLEDDRRLWHLLKPSDTDANEGIGDTGTLPGNKMASEIYLTRLLATKGTIQKFVDDLFETVFTTVQRGHGLPLAIKYMFDFLDQQAQFYRITDTEVVYTWKSNCLPLRFWVNLIKNPHFLFDVDKSPLVDSCLTVIGQTFMDSCSTSDHKLGKDSPSNKLLYAKDIPNYKQWVKRYYEDIAYMEQIRPVDMKSFLRDEFRSCRDYFNSEAALTQLYQFVQRYQSEIYEALDNDPNSRKLKLKHKLEQVGNTMTSTV